MKTAFHLVCTLFFLVATSTCCIAQSSRKDSILAMVFVQKDTHKVNSCNELARIFTPDSLSQAGIWADRALSQSIKLHYIKGTLEAIKNKGLIAEYKGELAKAIQWYDEGISTTRNHKQWEKEYRSFFINKGVAYYFAGDMGNALKNYIEAEKQFPQGSQDPTYAKLLNNLAVVYRNTRKYADAMRIYQKSLAIKKANGDSLGIANTLNNIGLLYGYFKNHPQTLRYLKAAKKIYEILHKTNEVRSIDIALAVALNEAGKENEAKILLKRAFDGGPLNIQIHELINAKLLLVQIYAGEGNYQKADAVLSEIEPDIIKTNFIKSKAIFYEWKAYVQHALDRPVEAYSSLLKHKRYRDTLVSEEKLNLEKEMEAKYLASEKESQIQRQELQILKNNRERLIYLFALLALGLILGFVYRLTIQQKRSNALLGEKNAQIQSTLEEKEVLLKEIHHRVKNNLQIISSLLSLQFRRVEDPKVLEAIQDGQNRVNTMALIHENLYQDEKLVGVDSQEYINQLIDSLANSYNINPENITITKYIDPLKLDVDTVIPLGLILNELISNALKYAFDRDQKGEIKLALYQKSEGLLLSIVDNGRGMPNDFDLDKLKSLGFSLIRSFAKKLDGVIKIWNNQGCNIEIFIPQQKIS
jgi:two-component system, sensor histidine kinase PdtaS